MTTDYREHAFEDAIENSLRGHGYTKVPPEAIDRTAAIFPGEALAFLKDSQPEVLRSLEAIHGPNLGAMVIDALVKALDARGAVDVLRHGFKFYGKTIQMAYWRPETALNPQAAALYRKDRLCITRQLKYSTRSENSVDVTLSVNGLPIATLELKNLLTGQSVENAKTQYRKDRDPRETLFAGKRAIVHFAVDQEVVFMTTKLAGAETRFLPFNKGRDGGAGNPDAIEGKYRTSYLWEEVLASDSLLDILRRFIHVEQTENQATGRKRESLIFPRFHQLETVRKLVGSARENGTGQNYLIQHSAGSGKSNTIAWLAHRLGDLHDSSDKKVFHSVIVITDRLILDRQLQDTIYQFEHAEGVVKKVDVDSQQLANALISGDSIIITTLQKFPFAVDKVASLPDRRYAIIVDEAHSSQTGEAAKDVKAILAPRTLEEAAAEAEAGVEEPEQWQDLVSRSAAARGRQKNLSFFAFTATPKAKTLEVFGQPGPDGKPCPFHLYSMRQAIEEGFILDVLQNYTTYRAYYKLIKQAEEDPKVHRRKAAAALARFMSLHPHNLKQKTEVMVEHFREHTRRKIGGQAKAMVVTASRLHAVRYFQAFNEYIAEKGYTDVRVLVAFSGALTDPDDRSLEYTESSLNKIRESEVPSAFESPQYQILLVAEKYQTGFDQPLLHTMYVDKRLKGLHAVQTLSRLNRIHPGKEDTFILDFVNTPDDIKGAFQPYYEATLLEEKSDPQHLYQLQAELDDMRVYTISEVENFCKAFFTPGRRATGLEHPELYRWVTPALDRFRALSDDDQEEFRDRLKAFVNLYAFLSQVIPFQDTDLEKRYAYARLLGRALPRRASGPRYAFDDDIALKYYRLQKISEAPIELAKKGGATVKGLTDVGTASGDDPEEPLSKIVELVNEKYGTEWTPADQLFLDQIHEENMLDEDLLDSARVNTEENLRYKFDRILERKFLDRMDQNGAIFERFVKDPQFQDAVTRYLLRKVVMEAKNHAIGEKT
jgi:type I restriction enzyme R subunit